MPAIPVTIPAGSLGGINELILKIIWKSKVMRIEKRVGKEVGRLMLPDFQICYKAATIKTHGERDAEINRRESRNRLRILANCFSTKVYKHINWKRKASSTDIAGATGHLYNNQSSTIYLAPKKKNKTKTNNGANVKPRTMKISEGNRRENIYYLRLGKGCSPQGCKESDVT